MANWADPVITNLYTDVMTQWNARDVDAATMFLSNPTNQPIGSIRLVRSPIKFQEWDGAIWQDKILSIAGGGTGANNANDIRINLGLGTMAFQNAGAVAITGGTLSGITALDLSGNVGFAADVTYNVGSTTNESRRCM